MSFGEDLLRQIGRQLLVAGEAKAPAGDLRVVALEELVDQAISLRRADKSEGAADQLFSAGLFEVHRARGVRSCNFRVTQLGFRPVAAVLAASSSTNACGQRLAQCALGRNGANASSALCNRRRPIPQCSRRDRHHGSSTANMAISLVDATDVTAQA